MLPLSQREQQIYEIYKAAILRNEKTPTMSEIGAKLGISYTAVNVYTKRIIEKGYLVRANIRISMILPPGGDA